MTPQDEFPKLLDLATEEVAALSQKTIVEHKLGELNGWSFEEATGRLLFTDGNQRYAIMNGQALGLYEPATQRWQWAWSDDSFAPHLTQAASHARAWGEANGIAALTDATGTLDEALVLKLAAFATRLIDWPGLYRGVVGDKVIYLAFSPQAPPH